jgi:hypothetical protein
MLFSNRYFYSNSVNQQYIQFYIDLRTISETCEFYYDFYTCL